jgi:hypothetical protein
MNYDIDTSDLVRVEQPSMRMLPPPIDMTPQRSPFFRDQFSIGGMTNPDSLKNFHMHGIPSYRIVPPQPLWLI